MQEITISAKLKAKQIDSFGYITYVFESLEFVDFKYKYIMCVQFPNWNQNCINEEEIGYLTYKHVQAGIDEWFDGNEFVKYNYTNVIFLKFIRKQSEELNPILVD